MRTPAPSGRRRAVGRILWSWAVVVLLAPLSLGFVALSAGPATAHAPHDQVTDIAFSPDFATTGRVFAIVRGRLMRSDDRGMSWHELVRGLGGETQKLRAVAVSPADPDVVFATAIDGALLRSDDGGSSWEELRLGLGVTAASIFLSPGDADTLFVYGRASSLLSRSDDGGTTWTRSQLDGTDIEVSALTALPDGRLLLGDHRGRILVSEDDGATWSTHGTFGESSDVRTMVATSDGAGDPVVFAATWDRRLLRSDDAGVSFEVVGDGLPDEAPMGVAVSPSFADDGVVWVSTRESGAHRSGDGGRTFEPVWDGLTRSVQADDIDGPHFTTIATAPGDSGIVLLAGFDGLFRILDGSDTWVPVETLTGYIAGLDVSPAYADDRTLAVMTYVRGAFISRDGGESWEFANDGLVLDAVDEGNRFAPLRRLHNVQFSPDYAADDTLWAANWVRVIRSTDAGRSWEDIMVGEPPEGSPLRQFVLAPSPAYADDHTVFAGTRQGEFFRSQSAGDPNSWELLSTVATRVRSVVPSPAFAEDDTIFVGTVGGLDRSTDGGLTWVDTGVRNEAEVTGREIDYGIQVAVSPDFAADGLVVAATDSGLFRSTDSGVTFEEVVSGPLTADRLVEAVAFSPTFADDGLLLVSVRGVGLLRSTDGGETFEKTASSLDDANLLIADYANPTSAPIQFSPTYAVDGTVYAYAQQALVRSTDGGVEWEVVELPSVEEVLASLPPFEPAGDASVLAGQDDTGDDDGDGDENDTPDTTTDDPDGGDEGDGDDGESPSSDDDDSDGGGVLVAVVAIAVVAIGVLGTIVVRRSGGPPS